MLKRKIKQCVITVEKNKLSLLLFAMTVMLLMITINSQAVAQQMQLRTGEVIDKIVAVVGNEIILQSDIDAILLDEMNRGANIKLDDEELRRRLLENYIEEKILITKAEEDTISVADETIEEYWNMTIQRLQQVYGSIERIEAIYKRSLNRMKLEAREDIKKRLMAQELEAKQFRNITVSSKGVEEFYEKMKYSLPMIPVQVELYHILKYITPDTISKTNTINLARQVRDSLIAGGDFSEFAKRYSEDPGSAQDGGNLGWVARGKFVAEFERAAFALHPDEISMPVESPFGYHLIKLFEKNRDSIRSAHILFKLIQTDADVANVRNFLDTVRQQAIDSNNFEHLALLHSDDRNTKGFGGSLGKFMPSEIPLVIANTVKDLKDGEISSPIPYSDDPTKQGMSIIWLKRTIPEHRATLEEDYDFLKQVATRYKIMNLRNTWIAKLKEEIYWEVFD
jgi:peptidyl-prolyl cis-trans isomerase SurA